MIDFGPRPDRVYVYDCLPLAVGNSRYRVDGDTISAIVDLGVAHVTGTLRKPARVRLWGVSCPEPRGATRAEGLAASAYTYEWLVEHTAPYPDDPFPLRLHSVTGLDAFGRILGVLWARNGDCLNADLLAAGHAVEDVR